MPIDTPSPEYAKMAPQWQRCRDALAGEDAVKERGVEYLPKLGGQTDDYEGQIRYENYKLRAEFYAVAQRTVHGLTGVLTRKPPVVEGLPGQEDATDLGASITQLYDRCASEVLSMGWRALLVDADRTPNAPPRIVEYAAEDILGVQTKILDGEEVPVMVRLRECEHRQNPDDEFTTIEVQQVRLLRLILSEDGQNPIYAQALYEKVKQDGGKEDWILKEPLLAPTKFGGGTWDRIPIQLPGPGGSQAFKPPTSPMQPVVNINLAHYRNSADYEHGIHFTALPTGVLAGFSFKDDQGKTIPVVIGSETCFVSENPQAHGEYMEFTGDGLGAIRTAMEDKQGRMAVLGARLLETPKTAVDTEAAESKKIRGEGERSVLAHIALGVSEAVQQCLRWKLEWTNPAADTDAVTVTVDVDFIEAQLDPADLTALVGAVQGGLMSWASAFWNLKRGNMVPKDRTMEQEAALIAAIGPGVTGAAPMPDPSKKAPPEKDAEPEKPKASPVPEGVAA